MFRKRLVVTKWCPLIAMALVLSVMLGAAPVRAVGGVRYVDKFVARDCGENTPCYHSIQAAVNNANPGDVIYVYPATYNAGVDLNQMNPHGDISLITVDANGTPTPGTVTVDNPGDAPEIYTGNPPLPFDGDVTIDGFVLRSEYSAVDLWVGVGALPAPTGEGGELGPAPLEPKNVVIRDVDASDTGGDGIMVRASGNVTIKDCITNRNNGAGIYVMSAGGDVSIIGCTSNQNTCPLALGGAPTTCRADGIGVGGVMGTITISDCTAKTNGGSGIYVGPRGVFGEEADVEFVTTPDRVTISRCIANENGEDGITARSPWGDVGITDCTTNGNGDDGVSVGGLMASLEAQIVVDGGDVTIQNCTSIGNGGAGFDPEGISGTLSIQSCIARNNQDGVDLDWWRETEVILVNGSIICGNECGISLIDVQETLESERYSNDLPTGMNFEGNWWGCAGGPEAPACDPICQLDGIPVDFTPWIAKITDSATVDPVSVGQPTVVSFQFSGNPSAVYLGEGPGDRRGPAPFTVSTDNGSLNGNGAMIGAYVWANGTLKVTLVPDRAGTATVTVTGPCGIGELEGAKAVLGVLEEEFVPEPGTALLLGSGLMGLAGYASLRVRRR